MIHRLKPNMFSFLVNRPALAVPMVWLGILILAGCEPTSEKSVLDGKWKTGPANSLKSNSSEKAAQAIAYQPRKVLDGSGYGWVMNAVKPWPEDSTLEQIAQHFKVAVRSSIQALDQILQDPSLSADQIASSRYSRSTFLNYEGDPIKAYEDLCKAREYIEQDPQIARDFLYTIIYTQGVTAMRRGENENCIACRGESSCILPISKAAVHQNPEGSRTAIKHFMEYLEKFPEDGHVRWLLNVAYMTLDEHPQQVPPEFLIPIDRYSHQEYGIGRFRDIGEQVGLNRFNQAGGAIMDDFDGDGKFDIVVSSFDPTQIMGLYRNENFQKFSDVTQAAGLAGQLGGLNCVQTDYNNDGLLDVFIVRGAWLTPSLAMRPSLLRNNGDMTFTDVTEQAGLADPLNSISATWADFDRDGWLDVFVCSEQQTNRLYRNKQDGTFENVATHAGLAGGEGMGCKGATWIDIENDGWPDLFLNHLSRVGAQLWRNNRDGTFENVSRAMGIDGPQMGFSCWTWDFNNDGWQDIFATNYSRSVEACVQGMIGQEHTQANSCLYMNQGGERFVNVTQQADLDGVFITMGSNFADFDNDGWLDFYLGTGDPNLGTLVPNRMFRNLQGKRFVDITASSGTGNLQKGHGVACGDWDRNGTIDLFIEMGGAVNGDKYHNILFQNPGNPNSWTSMKLSGDSSNAAAIGARIKIHTDDPDLPYVYRTVSSGSSFGANPLEQTIGLGKATRILGIEIQWPSPANMQDAIKTETIEGPIDLGKTLHIQEGQGRKPLSPTERKMGL